MFKKLNTKALLILVVVLLAIVVMSKLRSEQTENTFRSEFVSIDSSAVTQITIYPKNKMEKEVTLKRDGKKWSVLIENKKSTADLEAIRNFLSGFVNAKALSLAAQDKAGWKEFQVDDSAGTSVKINTNDKTYEMVIGKFGYNSASRNGLTYIRHKNEDQVYAIEGYMAMLVNEGSSIWRNKTFISGDAAQWTSLSFVYPGDSSFVISKQNHQWLVNGQNADSSKMANFIGTLANLRCSGFADNYAPNSTPIYSLTIQGNNQSKPISVYAYSDAVEKLILHSDLNNEAYFSEAKSHIADHVFVSSNSLLALQPVKVK